MNTAKNILVCVTQQKTCERLIKRAVEAMNSTHDQLYVIHVAKNAWNFLDNPREGEAIEYLFGIAKAVGANLTVLKSEYIIEAIVNYSKENGIHHIIMGESPSDHTENKFYNTLKILLKGVTIEAIPQDG